MKDQIKLLRNNLINIPGWRTNRKIIVIESDDWGSIRMPSYNTYQKCLNAGYRVDLNPYERLDSLASSDDLSLLFELLKSFRDSNGNHPVITANCVVANPDFEKISKDNFSKYHFELITDTFRRYPNHYNNFILWKLGIENRIFHPQYHAREHLNVSKFMRALQQNDSDVHFGFLNKMPGCINKGNDRNGNYFVEATNFDSNIDKIQKLTIYLEGLDIFAKLFGYKSLSIIPPNYTWSDDFNKEVAEKGVKYIQGLRKMREPVLGEKYKYTNRFLGKSNKNDQIALVRNVSFEPSLTPRSNITNRVLSEIATAYRMKKPAIISSHRINYVGYIDISNRDQNLILFKEILKKVLQKWPDVEFITSDELGRIIYNSH